MMGNNEVLGVDGVGDPIADRAHVAVDDGLTRDEDVKSRFLVVLGD
jgi:hypothetical protein